MDMPTDLPIVVLTPVSDAMFFAVVVGLLAGIGTVLIELGLSNARKEQLDKANVIKIAFLQICLYGAMVVFFAFAVLGNNPIMPLSEVKRDTVTLGISLFLGAGINKLLGNVFFKLPHAKNKASDTLNLAQSDGLDR